MSARCSWASYCRQAQGRGLPQLEPILLCNSLACLVAPCSLQCLACQLQLPIMWRVASGDNSSCFWDPEAVSPWAPADLAVVAVHSTPQPRCCQFEAGCKHEAAVMTDMNPVQPWVALHAVPPASLSFPFFTSRQATATADAPPWCCIEILGSWATPPIRTGMEEENLVM